LTKCGRAGARAHGHGGSYRQKRCAQGSLVSTASSDWNPLTVSPLMGRPWGADPELSASVVQLPHASRASSLQTGRTRPERAVLADALSRLGPPHPAQTMRARARARAGTRVEALTASERAAGVSRRLTGKTLRLRSAAHCRRVSTLRTPASGGVRCAMRDHARRLEEPGRWVGGVPGGCRRWPPAGG
jgi:hypothetical protein